jgi:hypothetical protein
LFLLEKYYYNDQIIEYEMGKACSTHGEKKNAHAILVRKPEGRDYLEDMT